MSTQIAQAFKDELAALLRKYKAGIHCNFDGDTHGIYNENISVTLPHGKEYKLADGFGITASTIGLRFACDSRERKIRMYDCDVLTSETTFENEAGYSKEVARLERDGQNVYKY